MTARQNEKNPYQKAKAREKISRMALAILFMVAGILHFVIPALYAAIVPPFLPNPRLLVAVSGACEFLGGAGVLIPQTRRFAGLGLIALLLAVWPANFNMAYQVIHSQGWTAAAFVLLLRLPLQIPLIVWTRSVALRSGQNNQKGTGHST